MSLDAAKVALAVQGGLSIVCATCSRYWDGRARGLPEPRCTSRESCASPLGGGTFHEYDGPITDFEQWCFRCGQPSDYACRVSGSLRLIGVCAEHAKTFVEMRPAAVPLFVSPELPVVLLREGREFTPAEVAGAQPKSLFRTLAALEAEDRK